MSEQLPKQRVPPPFKNEAYKKHNQQSLFYTVTMQYYDSHALSLTKYIINF